MQRDVHQPREPLRLHGWHARDGHRVQHAVADDTQLPTALCDQHVAARQERETPRSDESSCHHHDFDLLPFGGVERHRGGRQWHRRYALWRHRDVVAERHRLLSGAPCRRHQGGKGDDAGGPCPKGAGDVMHCFTSSDEATV